MNEWQPIETAPKDGTRVLLFGGEQEVWKSQRDSKAGPMVVGWADGTEYGEQAWRFCTYDSGFYGRLDTQPTHWMPLPEPPKESATQ